MTLGTYTLSVRHAVLAYINKLSTKALANVSFVLMSTILLIALHVATLSQSRSEHFLASTVVVCTELIKLILSLSLSFYFDGRLDSKTFLDCLVKAFVDDGLDVLKLSLPAILYTIQNNLQYIIESAPLFLVLYQSKIVTTAAFFTLMLSRRLSIKEWCAILTLAIGVSIVESSQHEIIPHHASNIVGMISVITACLTSGFAGVYYEKVLKASRSSIWILNVQLSMMSCSFSMMYAMIQDPEEIIERGLFQGFNLHVLLVCMLQAGVGLSVALLVKYSDNIVKGFASSLAIILSSIFNGLVYGDVELNERFLTGTGLVLGSSLAYYAISHDYSVAGAGLAVGLGGEFHSTGKGGGGKSSPSHHREPLLNSGSGGGGGYTVTTTLPTEGTDTGSPASGSADGKSMGGSHMV